MDAQERIEAGEPPETARQAARRDLGNLARVTEDTRATWGWTASSTSCRICATPVDSFDAVPASPPL